MIAGGGEEFSPTQLAVFDTLFATSLHNDAPKTTPAPYDRDRDGLVIGEGACTLILEEYERAKARGAKIYAEVVGFCENTDGTHVTNPNAATMAASLKGALSDAGFDIRAHIHDEVVITEPINGRSLAEVQEIMGRDISWAPGLPLRGDGYETPFYKKD